MRILFITIHFREYISEIKYKIEQLLGADVDLLYTDHYLVNPIYTLNKLTGGLAEKVSDERFQKKFYCRIPDDYYDYIFVLVGRNLKKDLFEEFIKRQKQAIKILYLWDDVKRVKGFGEIRSLFDRIFSFDPCDCDAHKLKFLPLFFLDAYRYADERKKYDLSCVGGLHSYRKNFLIQIRKQCAERNYTYKFCLVTTFQHWIKEVLTDKRENTVFLKFRNMVMGENADLLKQSRAVIDMPFPSQSGMTIRTFEALAAKTKIITTNARIKNYDFYSEKNVYIIPKDGPALIPDGFMNTPYEEISKDVIERYSINAWICNIFGEEY